MKKEIPYLHFIRVVACIMVVFLHSLPSFKIEGFDLYFQILITYLTLTSVPLFFMISGILILPVKIDFNEFYRKRLTKVAFPLIFWGIIYSILPFLIGKENIYDSLKQILMIPLTFPTEIGGILWYVYVLIGIYLIAPFLNPAIFDKDNKMMNYFILIWVIASLCDLIRCYEPNILGASFFRKYHLLSYFSGFIGYCLLGKYLHNNQIQIQKHNHLVYIFGFLAAFSLIPIFKTQTNNLYFSSFLSINAIIMTIMVFSIINKFNAPKGKLYSVIKNISNLSFGIYLSHMVIFRLLTFNIYSYSTAPHIQITVMTSTFIGAYILTFILSKVPYSKYIIGI